MQVAVERRPTIIFLLVLAALFVLMSRSTETRVLGETRTLFERTVMTIFSPIPRAVNTAGQSVEDAYHGYLDMRAAVRENLRLRKEVAQLTRDNLVLRRANEDQARLRSLLSYSDQYNMPTILAEVIMLDTSGRFKSLVLNQGSKDGIEVNDPVVNSQGLIGRVVLTTADMAKVQLMIDQNAAVGAMLARTRRQGLVHGNGSGGVQMYYVPALSDVQRGDAIVTAGTDGIFPRGISVGTVVEASEGKDLFKHIEIAPTVDFGSLEEVIVLHTRKIPQEIVRYTP